MIDINYSVVLADWKTCEARIRDIRTQVFILEQCVPEELEWDGHDKTAIHLLALPESQEPLGTSRLLASGQIGRMAVLREFRRRGIGSAMLHKLIQIAAERNITPLFLHAQLHAVTFYEQCGFRRTGADFDDAGIPHCKMIHKSG